MKQFRHKITGDIVKEHTDFNTGNITYTNYVHTIPVIFVENGNDWEEIKELSFKILKVISKKENDTYKEGTIITFLDTEEPFNKKWQKWWSIYSVLRISDSTEFKIGDNIKTKDTKDKFEINSFEISGETIIIKGKSGIGSPLHLVEHYKELPYKILKSCPIEGTIYSVERISDGEVFTLEDICTPNSLNNPAKITKFEFVLGDQLRLQGENDGKRYWYLDINTITKLKPVFITHDKIKIFEGDSYYTVFTKGNQNPKWVVNGKWKGRKLSHEESNWSDECKYFSSIEAASEFIKYNAPEYSLQDVIDFGYYVTSQPEEIDGDIEYWLNKYK